MAEVEVGVKVTGSEKIKDLQRDTLGFTKAQIALARQMKHFEKEMKKGVITADQYGDAIDRLKADFNEFSAGTAQAGNQFARYNLETYQATQRTKRFASVGLQQAGYQVGDFAVQLQGGTNAAVAFGQQGSQLLGIFGPAGAIAGAGLAIATAFIAPLIDAREKAKDLNEAFKEFDSSLSGSVSSSNDLLDKLAEVDRTVNSLTMLAFKQEIVESGRLLTETIEAALERVDTQTFLERFGKDVGRSAYKGFGLFRFMDMPEFLLTEGEILKNMGLDVVVLEGFFDTFQDHIDNLDFNSANIAVESLVDYIDSLGINLEDADPALRQIVLSMNQAAIEAERVAKKQDEHLKLLRLLEGKSSDTVSAIRKLADQYGLALAEAILLEEVDLSKGITPAVEAAAALAKQLDIAYSNAKKTIDLQNNRESIQAGIAGAFGNSGLPGVGNRVLKFGTPGKTYRDISDQSIETGGGSGGGSGGQSFEDRLESAKRAVDNLRASYDKEYATLLRINDAKEKVNELIALNPALTEHANSVLKDYIQSLEKADQVNLLLAETMSSSLGNAMMDIVTGSKNASQAFSDMTQIILKKAFELMVINPILNSIFGRVPGFNMLPAFGFSNGAAFSQGRVTPFADGGVVSKPTIFPMANGAGLMGEAGPEAIMPLKRDSKGRLGVSAEGSQQVHVTQVFNINGNGDKYLQEKIMQAAPQISKITQKEIVENRQRGGHMKTVFSR